jgi:hypothetical protein
LEGCTGIVQNTTKYQKNSDKIMTKKAFSEGFNVQLSGGKYTKWAVDMSEDTLRALLWMVGEYGIRVNALKEPTSIDEPDYLHLIEASENVRAKEALRIIALIVHGNNISYNEALDGIVRSVDRYKKSIK